MVYKIAVLKEGQVIVSSEIQDFILRSAVHVGLPDIGLSFVLF
jgi:hypothetical protein